MIERLPPNMCLLPTRSSPTGGRPHLSDSIWAVSIISLSPAALSTLTVCVGVTNHLHISLPSFALRRLLALARPDRSCSYVRRQTSLRHRRHQTPLAYCQGGIDCLP